MSMRTMVSLRWAAVAAIATLVGAWGGPAQAAPQHYRCITKQFSGDEAHMFAIREKRIAIELDPKTRRWYVDPGLMGGNHYPDTSDDLVVMHEFVTELPLSEDAENLSTVRVLAVWNQRTLEFHVTYTGEGGAELAARRWRCTALFEPRN